MSRVMCHLLWRVYLSWTVPPPIGKEVDKACRQNPRFFRSWSEGQEVPPRNAFWKRKSTQFDKTVVDWKHFLHAFHVKIICYFGMNKNFLTGLVVHFPALSVFWYKNLWAFLCSLLSFPSSPKYRYRPAILSSARDTSLSSEILKKYTI